MISFRLRYRPVTATACRDSPSAIVTHPLPNRPIPLHNRPLALLIVHLLNTVFLLIRKHDGDRCVSERPYKNSQNW